MSGPERLSRRFALGAIGVALVVSRARAEAAETAAEGALDRRFVRFDPPVPVPSLVLRDRNNRERKLVLRPGRATLIKLWATWCPSCHEDLAVFAAARESYAGNGVDLAAISVDDMPAEEVARRSADIATGLLPQFFDRGGTAAAAPLVDGRRSPLRAFGMPITFLTDRGGLVLGYVTGPVDWDREAARDFVLAALRPA